MKKTTLFVIIALTIFTLNIAGCAKAIPAEWSNDYNVALEQAKTENKSVLLVFSGDTWDGVSAKAKEDIYNTEDFRSILAKDFILVNVDIEESDGTDVSDELAAKYQLAEKFSVQALPAVFVVAQTEHIIAQIEYIESEKPNAKKEAKSILKFAKKANKVVEAKKALETTEGIDRVKHINAIYDNMSQAHRFMITELGAEVLTLDPENTTGLLGKFKLQQAYPAAMEAFSMGDIEKATKAFLDLTESDLLKDVEKQEAFYSVAYLFAMSLTVCDDVVIGYLQQAYDVAPKSDMAKNILNMIEASKAQSASSVPEGPAENPAATETPETSEASAATEETK